MECAVTLYGVPLAGGGEQVIATFVARPNRFVAHALLPSGEQVVAHIADRGRLIETLIPGVPLCLVHRPGPKRATQWQAAAAQRSDGTWASLDTLLPNRLMYGVLQQHLLDGLPAYTDVRREVQIGQSRFDFVLSGGDRPVVLEVKSAGRIVGDLGLVPDAPSTRAARHVRELAELTHQGYQCVLVVVAQGSVARVAIDDDIDPDLAQAIQAASHHNVDFIGVSSRFDRNGLYFEHAIPFYMTKSSL